jgi:serine/threonine-protein kinase
VIEERFGSYRVTETLGQGAVSVIHRAVQEPIGRVVAIKALRPDIAPTSSFGEQLLREAKVLADLAHPNTVLLLDSARTAAGRPYLVIEHVDGPSLQALLAKKKKLAVEVALAIAASVCAALEHAHERGIVHRDVKPSNVLLAKSGVVKMIDFGIAQRARTASVSDAEGITPSGRPAPEQLKDAYGTPAYMSPEQVLGDFVDARSDIFSLGVVLYQMTSGTRPFEEPSAAGRAPAHPPPSSRIRREAAAPLRDRAPGVPRTVERIVMRMLEKSPDDRYATASAVRERIEGALRAITREDPAAIVRGALAEGGFAPIPRKSGVPGDEPPRRALAPVPFAFAGHAVVLAAFLAGVVFVEGASCSARDAGAGASQLALAPDKAGALRVVATPWAHVRVDGQDVDTTPFARAIPLSAGKHWVTLTHPDSPPVEREVVITPGETMMLDVTMPAFVEKGEGQK